MNHELEVKKMRISSNKELFWLTLLLISGILACNSNSSNDLSLTSKIPDQPPRLVIQTGHSGEVYDVVFSPDGKLFASSSEDRIIKLWIRSSGKLDTRSHGARGSCRCLALNNSRARP
jgi:WD40 repeat protein